MKFVRTFGLALAALLLAGCDQLGGKPSVAVIDLDAVARALNRDDVIVQQINSANQQLGAQLGQVATNLQQQLQEEVEKYEVMGDEAQAELQQKTAVANQQLQQTQRLAQVRAAQFRQAVIQQFRNEVQPYASAVAKKNGAAVIITVATPMLWWEPAVDITDEVIADMRAAGLEAADEPAAQQPAAQPAPAAEPAPEG